MGSERGETKTGGREASTGFIPGDYSLAVGMPETPAPKGWKWSKLTDLARLESGHTPSRKYPEYWDGGVCWVGIRDATANHGQTIYDTNQHASELGIKNSSARMLPMNTVCLSRTASVGYVIVMGKEMATSQDFVNWVCSDELDHQFLKYILLSENRSFLRFASGTTHQTIYFPEVKAFHICHPPLPDQKAIAHILGSLDDKIELNRRMNATLEGMAQALFKSWFVDFDPVIDNALAAGNPIPDELADRAEVRRQALANGTANREAAKPFPAAFQQTESMGWIPKGWEISKAENLVARHKVKQKFTKKNALDQGAVPIFDQGAGLLLGYSNEPGDQDSSKENPKFIFGDHTCITHLSTKPFSVGPNVIPLSAKKYAPYWTFYAIKDLQEFQEYRRHWMEFAIKQVLLPSLKLAEVFDGQIREFRAAMESNDEITKSLIKLRDTLLPKLISGELRLAEG
jgi:type I restriction enzyme, S subunit